MTEYGNVVEFLSLGQTQELASILEARDWDLLEEFIIDKGYDESNESDMEYGTVTIQYEHRFSNIKRVPL